jgi:hypothetical protein
MTMEPDELHTDANAVAGMMQEVFAVEFTRLVRRCQSCGDRREAGALRSYAGAGIVLRCANCGDIAARLVSEPGAPVFELRGTWTVTASAR